MLSDTGNSGSQISESSLDFLKLQYQVLSERRINHNSLLWNVPSMLFVAQTFMWTITLNNKNNILIRCGISLLSIIVSYISFQMFERNRLMEVVDAEQMYSIEEYIRKRSPRENTIPILIIHHKLSARTLIDGRFDMISDFISAHPYYRQHNKKISLWKKASSDLWKIVFIFFFALSCVIFLYNFVDFLKWIVQLQSVS